MRKELHALGVLGVVACIAAAPAASQPKRWTLREISTIASADSGPARFTMPGPPIADSAGYVYFVDRADKKILAYDERGRHLWTVGRAGRGPTDFGTLFSLAWIGDTLVAPDAGNARVTRLLRGGSLFGQMYNTPLTLARLELAGTDIYAPIRFRDAGGRLGFKYVWLRGSGVDTLPARYEDDDREWITCNIAVGTSLQNLPYPPSTLTVSAPGGLHATVQTARYRIALVNRTGDTVRTVEKAHKPIPISDEQWAEATASLRRTLSLGNNCDGSMFVRPNQLPAIQDLFFDADSRLWVETWTATGRTFDIFDPQGRHIASTPAPKRSLLAPYVRGNRMYIVAPIEMGRQVIKVYAIDP